MLQETDIFQENKLLVIFHNCELQAFCTETLSLKYGVMRLNCNCHPFVI